MRVPWAHETAGSNPVTLTSFNMPATHTDWFEMLEDIRDFVRDNPGALVLCADEPREALLGFVAFIPDETLYEGEKMLQVSVSLAAIRLQRPEGVFSSQGRIDIARDLQATPPRVKEPELPPGRPIWERLIGDEDHCS